MKHISSVINKYISKWKECYYCSNMYNIDIHTMNKCNKGKTICKYCTGEIPV